MSAKHVALDRSVGPRGGIRMPYRLRSEEHTSELQSQSNLVCRLLLEKKKTERCLCQHSHLNSQEGPQAVLHLRRAAPNASRTQRLNRATHVLRARLYTLLETDADLSL